MKLIMAVAWLALVTGACADTIVTRAGENLVGDIIEESDSAVAIRITNGSGTIIHTRVVPRAEVVTVTIEPSALKQERAAHEALRRFQLNSDQELAPASYQQGIAAFTSFLTQHPDGAQAQDVRRRLTEWRFELAQVEQGLAKFRGKWLSPAQKQRAVADAHQAAVLATGRQELLALKRRLGQLEAQHDLLAKGLAETADSLNATESALAGSHDVVVPVVEYRLVTLPVAGLDWTAYPWLEYEPWVVGEKVYENPHRPNYEQQARFYERQITDGQKRLAELRNQIGELHERIARTEEHLLALTNPAPRQ